MKQLKAPRLLRAADLNKKTRPLYAFVERKLLEDLSRIGASARSQALDVALIGGLAIRAYAGAFRYTHDMDFLVSSTDIQRFIQILNILGYTEPENQLHPNLYRAAERRVNYDSSEVMLHIDISIDSASDIVSGTRRYPIPSRRIFEDAKSLKIPAYLTPGVLSSEGVKVISPEDLFILKTLIRDDPERFKDTFDVFLLLLNHALDPSKLWAIAKGEQCIEEQLEAQIARKLFRILEALDANWGGSESTTENGEGMRSPPRFVNEPEIEILRQRKTQIEEALKRISTFGL